MLPSHRAARPGGPGVSPAVPPVGQRRAGQFPAPPILSPPARSTYLAGAARPPGRRRRSRCSSSAGAAGTQSQPGSAPPGRRRGAASAGAAGNGRRGAVGGLLPPRPAGRGGVSGTGRVLCAAGESLGLSEPPRPRVITAEPASAGCSEDERTLFLFVIAPN